MLGKKGTGQLLGEKLWMYRLLLDHHQSIICEILFGWLLCASFFVFSGVLLGIESGKEAALKMWLSSRGLLKIGSKIWVKKLTFRFTLP
jgi:hypothetical protein